MSEHHWHPHFIIERNKYAPWGRGIVRATRPGTRAPYVLRKGNGKFDGRKP